MASWEITAPRRLDLDEDVTQLDVFLYGGRLNVVGTDGPPRVEVTRTSEVRLTVSWQDGKQKKDVTASQIIVILPESIGAADKVQPVQQLNNQAPQNLGQVPLTPRPPSSDPGQAQ